MIFFLSHRVGEIILISILVRFGKAIEDMIPGLCAPNMFSSPSPATLLIEQKLFLLHLTNFP